MKRIVLFLLITGFLGCKNNVIPEQELSNLNGYWEITEVAFADGTKKNYTVNPTIDFIHLENNQGFRKKVQPKFDGSFNTSNITESFKVNYSNEVIILQYENNLSAWEEKLVQLDSSSFSVLNEEGIKYSYKRFQPIVISK
ncbi:hypothetical protein FVB32_11310 [Flagellimonas hymeniacidonis]|uniref:Lipocalin-like domain-containing protein n=1 Tax=Flagellimonas hymeniacidonis TaxID=2603628 RepID=A0A5C8V1G2_9FLAO|nr:lipocalin family protein [Flagellimonas hymeniacidonis]TXN35171.1 hypothetical protein FVB32_11310 [Flagellimonas hymeniacidonis]